MLINVLSDMTILNVITLEEIDNFSIITKYLWKYVLNLSDFGINH